MAEKTPHELLRESLERNAKEVATWPSWMRSAMSVKEIFSVAPCGGDDSQGGEQNDPTQGTRPDLAR
jgi:hypothetical protein